MPVTHEKVVKALKSICRKLDAEKRKNQTVRAGKSTKAPTSYQLLKSSSNFEKLIGYLTMEINDWTSRYRDMYQTTPKHQVVGTLKRFFESLPAGSEKFSHLLAIIEAVADYLNDSKTEEERKRPRRYL